MASRKSTSRVWASCGSCRGQEVFEGVNLLSEYLYIGQAAAVEDGIVVMELDQAQAFGRPLPKEKVIVGGIVT